MNLDGTTYMLMGESSSAAAPFPQKSVLVQPTRTEYTFSNGSVEVKLMFCSPLLPDDLDVFTRPATYITWTLTALDGKSHVAKIDLSASGTFATNTPDQIVDWGPNWIGSVDQNVLGRSGDDLRIDWGRLYMKVPGGLEKISFPSGEKAGFPMSADSVALVGHLPTIEVGDHPVSHYAILAYDDEYSIQFFGENLRPWWKRDGKSAETMLSEAEKSYDELLSKCAAFDQELMADLKGVGGEAYAQIGALAYRQSFAAQKVVADQNKQPMMFSKENFSNGCIGTVDVLYPAAPQLLLFSPSLMKASLAPILEYAASPRWKFPFAPHDLGTYPLANGQVYGGGERTEDNQMPVEESGNMLILLAALAKVEGNADFAKKYWPQLSKWAGYLSAKGFDPESQLSTDDFAGHLAHNVNLSAKAIEALAAYAFLAEKVGKHEESMKYRALAKSFADRWTREARDGDHYKLAFDKPGTWSQKYNLVWDRVLGFKLFPESVFQTEMAYYRTRLNRYGLPLDSRRDYTKLDWCIWTATMAGNREDFETITDPIIRFLDDTPDRVPMTDWYGTEEPRKQGFQARSVVGGVFMKMLDEPKLWQKWAARDTAKVGGWAPIPKPPVITEVVATSKLAPVEWSYTTTKPDENWFAEEAKTDGWSKGQGGFGTRETPGAVVRTLWDSSDIWMRREFDLPSEVTADLQLYIHHDEDAEVYVNGILVARLAGYTSDYQPKRMLPSFRDAFRTGKNTLAIHCHQTRGGQYIDAGFATVTRPR
jgi:hypothetical protein